MAQKAAIAYSAEQAQESPEEASQVECLVGLFVEQKKQEVQLESDDFDRALRSHSFETNGLQQAETDNCLLWSFSKSLLESASMFAGNVADLSQISINFLIFSYNHRSMVSYYALKKIAGKGREKPESKLRTASSCPV